MTVASVLRSGGHYAADYVHALAAGLRATSPGVRFVCLTDVEITGVETVALEHGWPGWWSKAEMFRPGLFTGLVCYVDLDTLPVGDVQVFASYTGELAVLSDFFQPQTIGTGVVLFRPGERTEAIYRAFTKDPEGIMRRHRARSDRWYETVMGGPDRIQDVFPDAVVSLKDRRRPVRRDGPPGGAVFVCAHGNPRLRDPRAGWGHERWMDMQRERRAA